MKKSDVTAVASKTLMQKLFATPRRGFSAVNSRPVPQPPDATDTFAPSTPLITPRGSRD